MPKALQHEYPRWESDDRDPTQDVHVWPGRIRIVHGQRARKLRKRGVPLMPLHKVYTVETNRFDRRLGYSTYIKRIEPTTPNGRARYAWFEPELAFENRKTRKGGQCYIRGLEAQHGRVGRKYWLRVRLYESRKMHAVALMRIRYRRACKRMTYLLLGSSIQLQAPLGVYEIDKQNCDAQHGARIRLA